MFSIGRWIALVLLIASALAGGWWLLDDPGTSTKSGQENSLGGSLTEAVSSDPPPRPDWAQAERIPPSVVVETDDTASTAEVFGWVVDRFGEPVSDASIRWSSGFEDSAPSASEDPTRSDSQGRFLIPAVQVFEDLGEVSPWWTVSASGFLTRRFQGLLAQRVIQLHRSTSVLGLVRDQGLGHPVGDAQVTLAAEEENWTWSTTTEPAGQFAVPEVPIGAPIRGEITAIGFEPYEFSMKLLQLENPPVEFELTRWKQVTLRVIDAQSGQPIFDAHTYDVSTGVLLGTSNSHGELPIALAGKPLRIWVVADGYCGLLRSLPASSGRFAKLSLDLPLVRAASVEGTLFLKEEADYPAVELEIRTAARVLASSLGASGPHAKEWFPDDFVTRAALDGVGFFSEALDSFDGEPAHSNRAPSEWSESGGVENRGRFLVNGLIPGQPVEVRTRHPFYVTHGASVRLADPGESVRVSWSMEPGGSIRGMVLTDKGPRRALVHWQSTATTEPTPFEERRGMVETDAQGNYSVTGITPDLVKLQAIASGIPGVSFEGGSAVCQVIPGTTVSRDLLVTRVLETPLRIHGWVRGPSGTPMARAEVRAIPQGVGLAGLVSTMTDEDGNFSLSVERDRYDVHCAGQVQQKVGPGGKALEFALDRLVTARFRLLGDGRQLSSQRWEARTVSRGDWVAGGVTDPAGVLSFDVLPGMHDLMFSVPGSHFVPRVEEALSIEETWAAPVPVDLETGSSLEIWWEVTADPVAMARSHVLLLIREDSSSSSLRVHFRARRQGAWNEDYQISEKQADGSLLRRDPRPGDHALTVQAHRPSQIRGVSPGRYRLRCWPSDLVFDPPVLNVGSAPLQVFDVTCAR